MSAQSNQKSRINFEDIFKRLTNVEGAFDPSYLAIETDVQHGVPTRDLVRMHDQAPSARRTMMPYDESRVPSEVKRPMPLLKTRATIYLGRWNVHTMWDTERAFQIAAEMRRYKLEVLGISETH
ncbi:unnamed protein product [Schistosoma margrebowiei]|uniref:Uncharacterized protein n=1 Tax=Schistosoma margrebowiei TaxID=48269 RepID=A0A183MAS2_9TREM|nr:unnamed protein product [Schistosoma margrebowiei]